jgi:hypothetical protein
MKDKNIVEAAKMYIKFQASVFIFIMLLTFVSVIVAN